MSRHPDSVVTDDVHPLPQPPSVFAYLHAPPPPPVVLTVLPADCDCTRGRTCLEHSVTTMVRWRAAHRKQQQQHDNQGETP